MTPCPECEDQVTCPHSEAERRLIWHRYEEGSVQLAFMELVSLLRDVRVGVRTTDLMLASRPSDKGETLLPNRIDSALARWAHLPDFDWQQSSQGHSEPKS